MLLQGLIFVSGWCWGAWLSALQSRVDKMRQKALQQKLRSGLMALPEPQYTYEIEVPEVTFRLGSVQRRRPCSHAADVVESRAVTAVLYFAVGSWKRRRKKSRRRQWWRMPGTLTVELLRSVLLPRPLSTSVAARR